MHRLVVSGLLLVSGCHSNTSGMDVRRLAADEIAVSFPSAGLQLEGVLHLPERLEGTPVPGIVLVHGSGPNSRDEALPGQINMSFGFDVLIFSDLADGLAGAGYAVLRYDKRTCGTFNSCSNNGYPIPGSDVTTEDFMEDAKAAFDFLGQREDIDANDLVWIGHSQGAEFAPRVLTERSDVRAGVMLAGPARSVDEVLAYQLEFTRTLLADAGASEAQIDAATAELRQMVDALASLRAGTFQGPSIGGASVGFWRSWFAVGDEAPTLTRALDRPLLALGGDYDWNVPPQLVDPWSDTFAASDSDPGHRVVILPCVTHALNCISQPDYRLIQDEDIGRNIDASVIDAIVDFLKTR